MERHSLYWDDFERRISETVNAIRLKQKPPVRRVSVFITDTCNFCCKYCNNINMKNTLSESAFREILDKYGETDNRRKKKISSGGEVPGK